ncbi:MAG: hypothetical protein ACPGXL_10755, partial [Chitinophagales bacterium]
HGEFKAGNADTGFIKKYGEELTEAVLSIQETQTLLTTALLSDKAILDLMETTPPMHSEMGNWRN